MKYYLKTIEEVEAICKRNESFYIKETEIEGSRVKIADYRLASITDFIQDEAQELRGICFVEQADGSWKRNLLMNKFHNLNETKFNDEISWMYEDVKHKKVISVQDKLDGSICSPVKYPNGAIRMKSKTSFISDQAVMAQEFFNKKSIMQEEVDKLLEKGKTPIFELISAENQIVLSYKNTELILLQIRNEDGTYMSCEDIKYYSIIMGVKQAKVYDKSFNDLNKLLKLKETEENIEGYVVTLEDGQMLKIKCNWYLQLHRLVSPNQFQENHLIEAILDGNFDDIISQLNEGPKKEKFIELEHLISHKFNELVQEFIDLRGEYFNKYQENRKEFALANAKKPLFGSIMKSLNTSFRDVEKTAEQSVTDFILRQCKTLGSAKEFVEGL